MASDEGADFVEHLLGLAGAKAYSYFGRPIVERKGDGSLVTDADKAAEELIVEGLIKAYPGYSVYGEEGASVEGTKGTWYVDPLDGTSAFVEGLAHWGPTICLVENGELKLGGFFIPRLQEFWFAEKGQGAFRNQARLPVVESTKISYESVILLPSRFHSSGPLDWPGKARVLGSTAAHLALVAGQGALATIIPKWSLWDVGCGVLLAGETGHAIRGLDGHEMSVVDRKGLPFAVGAPNALRYLLDEGRLQEARRRYREQIGDRGAR
jgi:myo-inositol-1(or 4)-monophosphatase